MVKRKVTASRSPEKDALFEKAVKLGLPNNEANYKSTKDYLKWYIEVSTRAPPPPVIPPVIKPEVKHDRFASLRKLRDTKKQKKVEIKYFHKNYYLSY